ncbi:MAG: response regulator [Bacteroidetes bacterium]|nr:response regulator [Bacteroidota bacterium]
MDKQPQYEFSAALLIDDSETDNFLNSIILRNNNICDVIYTATNVDLALRLFQALSPVTRPQLILLDMELPEKNGFNFIEAFEKLPKDITEGIKISIVSAHLQRHEWLFPLRNQHKHPYIFKVIEKPLTFEKLMH